MNAIIIINIAMEHTKLQISVSGSPGSSVKFSVGFHSCILLLICFKWRGSSMKLFIGFQFCISLLMCFWNSYCPFLSCIRRGTTSHSFFGRLNCIEMASKMNSNLLKRWISIHMKRIKCNWQIINKTLKIKQKHTNSQ